MSDAAALEARQFAWRASALFAALFFSAGIQMAYLPAWFASRGLTPGEISLVLALPMVVRMATTPGITYAADLSGQQERIIVWLTWGALGAVVALYFGHAFWPLLAAMIVHASLWTAIMPLSEALAMRGVNRGGLDYGRMRSWGSVAFIAAGLVGGGVLGTFGAERIIILLMGSAVALVVVAHLIAGQTGDAAGANTQRADMTWRDTLRLLTRQHFIFLFLASGLGQASHAVYYAFATIYWQSIGIAPLAIGMLWAVGVAAEIGVFVISKRLIARFGAPLLLVVGIAAGVLRWPLTALEPPLVLLFVVQLLHGLTFGAVHLAAVHLIATLAGESRSATAQGVHNTFAAGLFMAGAIAGAGWLFAAYGGSAFFAMAALSALALFAALAFTKRHAALGDVLPRN
ncbi:MAG: MFS transporter [Pseudomonadota bacterium]